MRPLTAVYLVFGLMLVSGYAWAEFSGWEYTTEQRVVVPADVRHSPGGYRSFHFWHSGYHGGK